MGRQILFVLGCLLTIAILASIAFRPSIQPDDSRQSSPTLSAKVERPTPNSNSADINRTTVQPAVRMPVTRVLRIAKSFPDGGGFNWDGGTGTPDEIRFKDQKILSKAKRGTYCCGFTFAVVMRAAKEAGLLDGKSVAQIRKFQQHWYAATPDAREKQQIFALQWLGIGREVPLMEALPGDFLRLWHGGSGHSVILVRWVIKAGKKVGVEYRGTQGSTDGIGNQIEYLPGAPGHESGDFVVGRTYAGRLNGMQAATTTPSLDILLRKSPRFLEMLRVSPHPGYFIEKETSQCWIVAMGDNMEDHFARWETLRVWKTGAIQKMDIIGTGNWISEFRPNRNH